MVISESLTLGSVRREQQLRSHVLVCFRRLNGNRAFCDGRAVRAWLDRSRLAEMADLLTRLDEHIDEYLLAPVYPRVVEEILKISARERIRWTKDGRLETSGRGSFSCGPRSVHFPRYPVRHIEMLAGQAETISAWRDADALWNYGRLPNGEVRIDDSSADISL